MTREEFGPPVVAQPLPELQYRAEVVEGVSLVATVIVALLMLHSVSLATAPSLSLAPPALCRATIQLPDRKLLLHSDDMKCFQTHNILWHFYITRLKHSSSLKGVLYGGFSSPRPPLPPPTPPGCQLTLRLLLFRRL